MALIRCGGCESVHESTLTVCPVCGRCPGCGERRARDINSVGPCPNCQAPYCTSCGRCHVCGQTPSTNLPPCHCGHPTDLDKLSRTEESFALPQRTGRGCAIVIAFAVGLAWLAASISRSLAS